jgi:hypothetical protein
MPSADQIKKGRKEGKCVRMQKSSKKKQTNLNLPCQALWSMEKCGVIRERQLAQALSVTPEADDLFAHGGVIPALPQASECVKNEHLNLDHEHSFGSAMLIHLTWPIEKE